MMLFPTKDTKTRSVIKSLSKVAEQFEISNRVVCDRGTCFTPENFEELKESQ